MDYHKEAIDLLIKKEYNPESVLVEIAKNNPSVFVTAAKNVSTNWIDIVQPLIKSGRRIEAIKRYRDLTGRGLKESKEAIDLVFGPRE